MIDSQRSRHSDIERVLGAELGYLKSDVGGIHHLLRHSMDFVSDHDGIFTPLFGDETGKRDRSMDLFEGAHRISFVMQSLDRIKR